MITVFEQYWTSAGEWRGVKDYEEEHISLKTTRDRLPNQYKGWSRHTWSTVAHIATFYLNPTICSLGWFKVRHLRSSDRGMKMEQDKGKRQHNTKADRGRGRK